MAAGRPTKYTPELLEKADYYLSTVGNELPSVEGLAVFLDIRRSTIYEWQKEHDAFSDILEKILVEQAKKLMNNGLTGKWNSTITKLILTKHGYSDKIEQDVTSGGKPIPILGNLNVPTNNRNPEDSQIIEADKSSAGRDESIEDNLDTSTSDSGSTER